jgi:Winged helix-turn-helix DNA-binding
MSGPRATSARYNSTPSSLYVVPDSSVLSPESWGQTREEEPEIEQLLALHAAGAIEPVRIAFPAAPASLSTVARAVLDDFARIRGLRLAAGDDRPVPYGKAWVAARVGWSPRSVWRALRELEAAGLIRFVEELPLRGKGNGTKTYLPGGDPR